MKMNKDILNKEISAKEALIAIGVLIGVFAYGFVFIYPKYSEYKATKGSVNVANTELLDYKEKLIRMPELEDSLSSAKRELVTKSRNLNHDMMDGLFLIGLDKQLKSLDVDLVEYTPQEPIKYETFYAIPTSLTLRGNYKKIREIMYYLEEQKNTTQILDYSMDSYIPPANEVIGSSQSNDFKKQVVNIEKVYWTLDSHLYHSTESCPNLKNSSEVLASGPLKESERTVADTICVASGSDVANDGNTQSTVTALPKAKGDITATFKFIMYTSEDPKLELDVDDSNNWKPGKYNPFVQTN
ncbi:MAG: type 4a pilus biogenesis protein PilO [Peptostreptococcaceae bacterium]